MPVLGTLRCRFSDFPKFRNARLFIILFVRNFVNKLAFPKNYRVAPVRFGSVTVWEWNGSSSSGFRFLCFSTISQRTVPVPVSVPGKRFGGSGSAFGSCENGSDGSGFWFRFGSWATLKLESNKINANSLCTKFLENASGHGHPRHESWTSAPNSDFSCGPSDGEKLFDPGAFKRKGQECLQEIRTEKFIILFLLP